MARISIKPIEPLELEFADGTVKKAIFNVEALIHIQDTFGNLQELAKTAEFEPFDFASKILYGGLKTAYPTTTLEDCEVIVAGGGAQLLSAIMDAFMQNFDSELDADSKKKLMLEWKKTKR